MSTRRRARDASLLAHPVSAALELPEDPTIDALSTDLREAVAAHWRHRAVSEARVALAFEALRPRLAAQRAAPAVLALVDKAIEDERRHSALCTQLEARYRGADARPPEVPSAPLPDFGTGDEALEVALLVLATSCVNESIASEWIRSCFRVATAPTALFANREHLQDEIDHARLGWAHFASSAVSAELKARVRPWVRRVLDANVREWRRRDAHLPEGGLHAHGHLSASEHDAVIDAALRDVVEPGLVLVGLSAT